MAVGVSVCFYGFLIEKQSFWSISCSFLTKPSFQIVIDLDRECFKDCLAVFSNSAHSI